MKNSSFQKGFTLIELLVVISIIGVLSSIVLPSLSEARVKARNARVNQEIGQWLKAVELYREDNNRDYPNDHLLGSRACLGGGPNQFCNSASVNSSFVSEMTGYIPTDLNPNRTPLLFNGPLYISTYSVRANTLEPEYSWFLEGDDDCGNGATGYFSSPNTWCYVF